MSSGGDGLSPSSNGLLFIRPMTLNGVVKGTTNQAVDGSSTHQDFYVEAGIDAGEIILVTRLMVQVTDTGSFDSGSYGNGLQFFHRKNGLDLDATGILPIKLNTDWSLYAYDTRVDTFGSGPEVLSARFTFAKLNGKGLRLNPGDRIGVRVRDDLSGIVTQTIMAEGAHLNSPDPAWGSLVSPPTGP